MSKNGRTALGFHIERNFLQFRGFYNTRKSKFLKSSQSANPGY